MVIIGRGMIASEFKRRNIENVPALVFASGVADSSCNSDDEYHREILMLQDAVDYCISNDLTLFYPSSGGSVYGNDDDLRIELNQLNPVSAYGMHKVRCEKLIQNSGAAYIIARLPNIVGGTSNTAQLIPFLFSKAATGNVRIYTNACRDLLWVEDLVSIALSCIEIKKRNYIVNIASGVCISIADIVKYIKEKLDCEIDVEMVNGGDRQLFSIEKLREIVGYDLSFSKDYPYQVLDKYIEIENLI